MNDDKCIDACNSLLRGELSAIETYGQAYDKFEGQTEAPVIHDLRASHAINADLIRQHILSMNGAPSTESGAWGMLANAIEGVATLVGESASLQALIAGEEHGVSDYESALENEDVMEEMKNIIRTQLLPVLHANIAKLKALQKQN